MLYELTHELFNDYLLQINNNHYQISEIEFYIYSDEHPDTYVHRHPAQLKWGRWFFHRASNKDSSGYKGGTRKGLDLTLSDDIYFSVLIRSIYNLQTHEMISGPSKVVDYILSSYSVSSIEEFQEGKDNILEVENNFRTFTLIKKEDCSSSHLPIYVGKRVGLNSSNNPHFSSLPYRFVQRKELIKREKNNLTLYKP